MEKRDFYLFEIYCIVFCLSNVARKGFLLPVCTQKDFYFEWVPKGYIYPIKTIYLGKLKNDYISYSYLLGIG